MGGWVGTVVGHHAEKIDVFRHRQWVDVKFEGDAEVFGFFTSELAKVGG
jgi:hypothetical protein